MKKIIRYAVEAAQVVLALLGLWVFCVLGFVVL